MVRSKKQSILLGMILWPSLAGLAAVPTPGHSQQGGTCWSLKGLISGKFTLKWRSCRIFLAIFYTSNRTGSWNGHWFSGGNLFGLGRSTLVFGSICVADCESQAARQLGENPRSHFSHDTYPWLNPQFNPDLRQVLYKAHAWDLFTMNKTHLLRIWLHNGV